MRLRLYTKAECRLCEETKELLLKLKEEFNFRLEEVDIYRNRRHFRRFRLLIPVVTVWGKATLHAPITEASLREALSSSKPGPPSFDKASTGSARRLRMASASRIRTVVRG